MNDRSASKRERPGLSGPATDGIGGRVWGYDSPDPDAPPGSWLAWANQLPMTGALGITCTSLDAGEGTFVVAGIPFPLNPNGAVNGGMVAAAADQVMGVLAAWGSPAGYLPATGALHVQYHRPAFPRLTMRAALLPGGRRVQFVEVVVEDRDRRRCATAHGTMVIGGAGRPSPSEG